MRTQKERQDKRALGIVECRKGGQVSWVFILTRKIGSSRQIRGSFSISDD